MHRGRPIRGGGDGSDDGEPVRQTRGRRARYVIDDDDDDDDEAATTSNNSTVNSRANSGGTDPKIAKKETRKGRTAPVRTNIAREIMGDDPANDIELVSPPPPHDRRRHHPALTDQDMSTSLKTLSPYLQPKPTEHEISTSTTVDCHRFSVQDDRIQSFIEDVVANPNVPNLETMLLAVEAIGRSSSRFMKAMFKKSKKENPPLLLGGYVVFKKWLCFLFDRLEDRFQDGESGPTDMSGDEPQGIEEMIASSILDLICKFNVIKDLKQISLLKSKFSVDWFTIVEKSIQFGSAYELSGLIKSSKNANNHLNTIKKGSSGGIAPGSPSSSDRKNTRAPSGGGGDIVTSLSSPSDNKNDASPSKMNRNRIKNWIPPKSAASTPTGSPSRSLTSNKGVSTPGAVISSPNDSIGHRNKNWTPPPTEQSNTASNSNSSISSKWIPPKSASSNAHTATGTPPATSSSQQRMARLLEDAKRKHDPTSQPPPQQQQQQGAASDWNNHPQKKHGTDHLKPASSGASEPGGRGGWGETVPSSTAEKSGASAWGKNSSDKSSGDGGWGSSSVKTSTGWGGGGNTLSDKNVTNTSSNGGWGSGGGWNEDKPKKQSSEESNNGQSTWSSNGGNMSEGRISRNPSSSSAVINEPWQRSGSASNSRRNEFGNNVGADGDSNSSRRGDRTNSLVDNLSEDGEINDPQSRSMHLKRKSDVSSSSNTRDGGDSGVKRPAPFRYRDLEDSVPYPSKKTCYDKSSSPRVVSTGSSTGNSYGRDSNHTSNVSSSGGMGRGRGREKTLPAWMSRQESAAADVGKVRDTNTSTREEKETPRKSPPNYSSMGNERSSRGDMGSSGNGGGRGRERTTPAWMSNQQANNASSLVAGEGTQRQRDSTEVRQVSTNEMKGGVMSGGRGRERTMPSWMTKTPNNSDTAGSACSNRELDRNTSAKTRQVGMNASIGGVRAGMTIPPSPNADCGRSRQLSSTSLSNGTTPTGRGRGMTTPAWMTNTSSNIDQRTMVDARRDGKYRDGDGGVQKDTQNKVAVGRGRGMTTPAWMTKNPGNADYVSSTVNQRNAATEKMSRQVTDTERVGPQSSGRGRERTAPAWMTQKRNNADNGNAESQCNPIPTGMTREPNCSMDRRHNTNVTRGSIHQAATGRTVGTSGIGRGRGATTPAWMTKKVTNAEQGSADTIDIRNLDRGESGGRSNSSREREQLSPNKVDIRRGNQDVAIAGRNSSMGRGHDQTLPSCVSEGNHRDDSVRHNREFQDRSDSRTSFVSRSYSEQTSNSRHETGRNHNNGNHMQNRGGGQDNGSRGYRDHRDHESRSSNFLSDRGVGRSLGRGKDINRPAWMSKN